MCTHTADIDYETIITYTGGYDDMVLQKTSVRTRIESQNEQREKKIAQLNDFHRALLGRYAVEPGEQRARRKWNGWRPPSWRGRTLRVRSSASTCCGLRGKNVLEFEDVSKSYPQKDGKTEHVIKNFSASVMRGDKVILMGRNGQGKTTLIKALLANAPGVDESD